MSKQLEAFLNDDEVWDAAYVYLGRPALSGRECARRLLEVCGGDFAKAYRVARGYTADDSIAPG